MSKWPRHYILIDRVPFAVDPMTWAKFFEDTNNRRVAEDRIGKITVSTVFLGLDHNYHGRGDPILFETMVFGGALHHDTTRYQTWAQAEAGHAEIVTQVRIAQAKIKSIADKVGAGDKPQ